MALVVRVVRGEKNIKRKYKLITGTQHTNVADADSMRISEVVVQFKRFRIKYPLHEANKESAKILSGFDGFCCDMKWVNPGTWPKTKIGMIEIGG